MKEKTIAVGTEVLNTFFANLQKALSDSGLSAYAYANKIGVDKMAVSNILQKRSDPKLSTVIRIAKGMNVSMDWLVGTVPFPPSPSVKPDNPSACACPSPCLPKSDKPPVSEVEIKKEHIDFIDKISKMHGSDIALLEAIAGILEDRRTRVMAKLLNAIKDKNSPENLKEGRMAKVMAKTGNSELDDDDDYADEGFDDFDEEDDREEFDDDFDEDFEEEYEYDSGDSWDDDEDLEDD